MIKSGNHESVFIVKLFSQSTTQKCDMLAIVVQAYGRCGVFSKFEGCKCVRSFF